jgi:hypothetical protein
VGYSTTYYQNNEKARKKKQVYDALLNKRKNQVKKRVESNRARRIAKKNGTKVKGKDYDHATNSFVLVATNRGRKGEGGRKIKSNC